MADVVNTNPANTLWPNAGHHFRSVASFPWKDPVNGERHQESIINIFLQTQTLENRKLLMLQGEIKLDSHSHTTARRFKLKTFKILAVVLHGTHGPTHALEPHHILCDSMSPTSSPEYVPTTQQTGTAGFTLNPSPNFGQIQFITSTSRTYLGSSIMNDYQQIDPSSDGTVWSQKVEDPGEMTFGGSLGTFSAGFRDCIPQHTGCSADDPTSLSLTVEASFSDTSLWSGHSSKPIIQTVSIHYPTWPDLNEESHAGEHIITVYNTNFSGREVQVMRTTRGTFTINGLPQDVSYDMEVYLTRGSGSHARIVSSKLYGAVTVMGDTLKVVGRPIRHPSRFLNMMIDRQATRSTSNP